MEKMFKCESGIQFSHDDCIMVSVIRPELVQEEGGNALCQIVHIGCAEDMLGSM